MEWIDLSQKRDRWRALVNAVMYPWFYRQRGISWLAKGLLASQKGLCSKELVSWLVSQSISPNCMELLAGLKPLATPVEQWKESPATEGCGRQLLKLLIGCCLMLPEVVGPAWCWWHWGRSCCRERNISAFRKVVAWHVQELEGRTREGYKFESWPMTFTGLGWG